MEAATNLDERRRLSVLESYEVLDSEAESAFDRVVRTAARIFRTPMASVSLVDANRQWFKSCVGIDATETSREISFCTHALASDDVLVIPDATADPRFSSNPVVTGDPFVRFYAGAPLIAPSGERLGTLCVIDTEPREPLDAEARHTLVELAALVMDLLETRKLGLQREASLAEADETNRLLIAALREGREMAERANHAKSDFLSRMSHELRTPLNAILGFGQLLELDDLTEDQAQNVAEMIRGGKHLLELINEILDISRIETGRLALSIEPVPLVHVVEGATSLIRPLAAQRGIVVTIDPVDPDLHVLADQQRLTQILINLLSNAIKYNRERGSVHVSTSLSDGGGVVVAVADTGLGIRPDQADAIFEPFERAGAEAGYVEGTGLGLAISRRLAEAMEGHLSVTSVPGSGSTFSLELRATSHPSSEGATIERRAPELEMASTILYVEDNLSNLRLVECIIARTTDVRLISCGLGADAVPVAARERPDLVLLDLNLPDMSGRDVLHRLQLDPLTADIPVVVLSADATPGQKQRLLRSGARAYLAKPIDVASFKSVIEEVLAGPENDVLGEDQPELVQKRA